MKLSELRRIIKVVEDSDIEELELRGLFRRIRITKKLPSRAVPLNRDVPTSHIPQKEVVIEKKEVEFKDKFIQIKAPMVGTFYHSPSPEASPFVEIGDKVTLGKVVCIIEAMKVMNEIESEVTGTLREILVSNEEAVEYGQALFLVEPEG